MNYGERQERAEYLVKRFREIGDVKSPSVIDGRVWTYTEMADEIENMTERGVGLVAVAGLVFQAMARTPEFFKR